MRSTYLLFALNFLVSNAWYCQSLSWAKSVGGPTIDSGRSIIVDDNGFVYSTGNFEIGADFDPGNEIFILDVQNYGGAFVLKQDPDGNLVWAKAISGDMDVEGVSIDLDSDGNIFTTGSYRGTVDFDPSANAFNLTSAGQRDAYILKLSNQGDFIWAKSYGGANIDMAEAISIDSNNNIISTGFYSYVADLDPGPAVAEFTSQGLYSNCYIQKLDADGNFLWANGFGGLSADHAFRLETDSENNIYTSGNFYGTSDFDPGPEELLFTAESGLDIYVQKLDGNGQLIWAKQIPMNYSNYNVSMDIDELGNVYVGGVFANSVDFDSNPNTPSIASNGEYDLFIQKYNSEGTIQWVNTVGEANYESINCIHVDLQGNVYFSGTFVETVDFDPSAETNSLVSSLDPDNFLCKWDTNGEFVWVQNNGGPGYIFSNDITTDIYGNLFLTGNYFGTTDLDPSSNIPNLISNGDIDNFIMKFSNCTVEETGIDVISSCNEITWIDGITYSSSNYSATHTFSGGSNAGCDSTVFLNFTLDPLDLSLTVSDSSISSNQPDASYQWYECTSGFSPIYGETSSSYYPEQNGYYAVEITFGECREYSDCIEFILPTTVGISDLESSFAITAYPNPSSGIVHLEISENSESYLLTVNNVIGQTVYLKELNSHMATFDLSNLNKGLYFLKLLSKSNKTYSAKIILE